MIQILENPVEGPAVWRGDELALSDDWIVHLDETELIEFERVLSRVRASAVDELLPEDFTWPTFREKIDAVRRELDHGRGFVVLRGLPVHDRFSKEDVTRLYWGIGRELGGLVSQNAGGELVGNIWDAGGAGAYERTFANSNAIDFHTDSTDVVGLLCLREALHGGESLLASTGLIYNIVVEEHPEYLPILYRTFCWDHMNEQPLGEPGWYPRQLFCYRDGLLSGTTTTARIISAMRFEDVPRLTAEEMSCFLYLRTLPWRPGIALSMNLEEGDIQLVHNYVVVHSRAGFIDHPTDEQHRRHLLRLWVSRAIDGRPVSAEFAARRAGVRPRDPVGA